jgi:uncharacterized protein YihD (DUF1040 family)
VRDPNRIPVILERLRVAWEKHPDLRLGQVIANASECRISRLFYLEDEALIVGIERMVEKR